MRINWNKGIIHYRGFRISIAEAERICSVFLSGYIRNKYKVKSRVRKGKIIVTLDWRSIYYSDKFKQLLNFYILFL